MTDTPKPAEKLFDAPIVDAATRPFWEGVTQGKFLIKKCRECGKPHWYPRTFCPYCMGDTEWIESSGEGTIYSFTVTRRADPGPYSLAYVALKDGVTVMTNIVDCDLDSLRIGDPVRVTFKPAADGSRVPMFTPARL